MKKENAMTPFEGTGIRKTWYEEQWFFSVVDVIFLLTDSKDPQQYWKRLNQRDTELKGTVQIVPLLLETAGGKQKVLCTNTQGILRIVMSVPSPKAEPLKVWLAQVGTERIQETENPELLSERQAEIYRLKGYSEEWIARRVQTIETRKALTEEWKNRGVKEGQEYSILTAEIAKGTFGLTPSEHSQLKGLDKQNLRDHMTPLELIFVALSEEVTRRVTIKDDAKGFNQSHESAVEGGRIANAALNRLEIELQEKVVSSSNFLNLVGNKDKAKELDSGEKE
jgi:DNA-damage-inducible protein D